jgi:hypothetical protein
LLALWLALAIDHSAWDRVVKTAVNEIGEIDYARLKREPRDLQAYVEALRAPVQFTSREDELAYWINAYNALVTHGVTKAYPTKSVRDLGILWSFFRRREFNVGGRMMSLDDIEHRTIRAKFKEPRIHFVLVCASLSCPRLAREAFVPGRLEQQIDFQTRRYFQERRNVIIDAGKGTVTLNGIFGYYKEDFGGSLDGALAFARKYLRPEDAAAVARMKKPKVLTRDYDWSINDPGSRARAKSPEERSLTGL